ncbi:MAG: MTAP family purine nucleoside phosphorylase [Chloroflexi bacterium]|nr:MTAP family purine nucleoside phosphorylase [Chloroflexota bacterium]MCI0644563.1 MTAP family purine nucleoside phosphorylase [Chloroflexota bacterium]
MLPPIVIFGGTAAYHIQPADFARVVDSRAVETPYGHSSRFYQLLTERGTAVWFASRHGEDSLDRSARFVNHRANLWAAQSLGGQWIFSWNGVGAINPALHVGDLLAPAAVMDWTRHRVSTFGPAAPHFAQAEALQAAARTIDHINYGRDPRQTAHPFDERARETLLLEIKDWRLEIGQSPISNPSGLSPSGRSLQSPTYVCTEGPRLETAAEIELAASLGADMVGMTLCPEVWLAAELGLGYASLCLVTNFATGRRPIDPRREFGPEVAGRALRLLLGAADNAISPMARTGT